MHEQVPARRFRALPEAEILGVRVRVAATPCSRLLGLALLAPDRAPGGLLLERCRSIHTFGMRFPIDVHFLDEKGCAVRTAWRVGPGRMLAERRAVTVLEIPVLGGAQA